ncbi:MAG: DUF924 domain-containing protein [Rhodospirillales bacterium]|nr:DUF924 domain-containing protein [Rhodospirillales bacterium]
MDMNALEDITRRVLDFWFGADRSGADQDREIWFKPTPEFDGQIRALFAEDCERAACGELDGLLETAHGCLTLVILTDQFPRNLHRGTAEAFSCDAKALSAARHALERGFDRDMKSAERMFLYMPFEHSEDLADQNRAVALFEALGNENWLDYAIRHRDIIARFGRFPHRNEILSRESTAEETEFLKEPGSSF